MKKDGHDQHPTTDHNHHDHHAGHHHHFRGINQWIARLDNPEREKKQRPREVIEHLDLYDDDVVADIGAGTGYFALRIAKAYPQVKVLAADAQQEMIDYLKTRAEAQNLTNLEPVVIHPAKPELPVRASLAIMVDTFHHLADRVHYLSHLTQSMAPGSRIAIIDYKTDAQEGPPSQHRISKDDVAHDLDQVGYTLQADWEFLPNQYFLIFERD